ncbi:MAG: DUF998 domain-containing protein [Chloroflexi bacterium]|nr:DUF998 domain-containing protein [Chloroflexota bacterium]
MNEGIIAIFNGLTKWREIAWIKESLALSLKNSRLNGRSWLAVILVAIYASFLVNLVGLHLLRPEIDPVSKSVSHYAIGPYGHLLTVALFAVGVGALVLACLLYRAVSPRSSLGSLLLAISGAGMFIVAGVPTDIAENSMPVSEYVHNVSFMVSYLTLAGSMFAFTRSFRRDRRWQVLYSVSAWLSLLVLLELGVFLAANLTSWVGIAQRFAILTVNAWLLMVSIRLMLLASAAQRMAKASQERGNKGRLPI